MRESFSAPDLSDRSLHWCPDRRPGRRARAPSCRSPRCSSGDEGEGRRRERLGPVSLSAPFDSMRPRLRLCQQAVGRYAPGPVRGRACGCVLSPVQKDAFLVARWGGRTHVHASCTVGSSGARLDLRAPPIRRKASFEAPQLSREYLDDSVAGLPSVSSPRVTGATRSLTQPRTARIAG